MIKCFLSHSSANKKDYVEIVARMLNKENIVYDAHTFEEGMGNLDEILKGLSVTDIFIIFLSNDSLNSDWVIREIREAKDLHNSKNIKKIFPIVIDKTITHEDARIPEWMRKNFNLRLISRPTIAVRRIKQRMRELSWEYHPRLKEKDDIFVGRNELLSAFEERIDDFNKKKPSCIIAGGLESIGRRTFLKKAFQKANIVDKSYEFSVITLEQQDSIEDFILRIYDLGFSEARDITSFLGRDVEEKISIAAELLKETQAIKERILIVDNGCIVGYDRDLAKWFRSVLEKIEKNEMITLAVASRFRVRRDIARKIECVFTIEVPELDIKERSGLLKRYAEFEKLQLSSEDLSFFSGLLNGFPQQVFFAVEQIKDFGIDKAKKDSHEIVEYNSEKANKILYKYMDDAKKLDFLSFLSHFDFISYEFIFDIVDDSQFYENLLEEFLSLSVCEELGSNKEYIRVNDALRDYLNRNRFKLPDSYSAKLREHVNSFVSTYKDEDKDVSDFLYSVKEALVSGRDIDERYLIPSHFLKTIKDLYDQYNRYDDVIKLADRILTKEKYLDNKIARDVRYYLCLSLARRKKDRLLTEVQKIDGPEHNFLLGFYYRLKGRYSDAIDRLQRALGERSQFSRARRELVQVYNYIEDYGSALSLAKANYEDNKFNPFHIQAYFHCVLKSSRPLENKKLLEELLLSLEKIQTEVAQEMFMRASAEYYAFNKGDFDLALSTINNSIDKFPDVVYSYFSKFDICEKYKNVECMTQAIDKLIERIDDESYFYNALLRAKCIHLAYTQSKNIALSFLHSELQSFPVTSREKIRQKIESIS